MRRASTQCIERARRPRRRRRAPIPAKALISFGSWIGSGPADVGVPGQRSGRSAAPVGGLAFLFRRRLSRQPLVGLRVAVFALVWHLIWIRFHEILLRPSGAESALYRTTIPGRWGGFSSPAIRMEQEPGSAGAAVVSDYRRRVLGAYNFKGVLASGSKGVRAYPVASRAEAGELLLVSGRWNTEFIDELCSFSQGPHDD